MASATNTLFKRSDDWMLLGCPLASPLFALSPQTLCCLGCVVRRPLRIFADNILALQACLPIAWIYIVS